MKEYQINAHDGKVLKFKSDLEGEELEAHKRKVFDHYKNTKARNFVQTAVQQRQNRERLANQPLPKSKPPLLGNNYQDNAFTGRVRAAISNAYEAQPIVGDQLRKGTNKFEAFAAKYYANPIRKLMGLQPFPETAEGVRALEDKAEQQYPGSALTGTVGGSVLTGVGAAGTKYGAKGLEWLTRGGYLNRAGKAVGAGGAYGATEGSVRTLVNRGAEGELPTMKEWMDAGTEGAMFGAAGGAAGQALGTGLKLGKKLIKSVANKTETFGLKPEQFAPDYVNTSGPRPHARGLSNVQIAGNWVAANVPIFKNVPRGAGMSDDIIRAQRSAVFDAMDDEFKSLRPGLQSGNMWPSGNLSVPPAFATNNSPLMSILRTVLRQGDEQDKALITGHLLRNIGRIKNSGLYRKNIDVLADTTPKAFARRIRKIEELQNKLTELTAVGDRGKIAKRREKIKIEIGSLMGNFKDLSQMRKALALFEGLARQERMYADLIGETAPQSQLSKGWFDLISSESLRGTKEGLTSKALEIARTIKGGTGGLAGSQDRRRVIEAVFSKDKDMQNQFLNHIINSDFGPAAELPDHVWGSKRVIEHSPLSGQGILAGPSIWRDYKREQEQRQGAY